MVSGVVVVGGVICSEGGGREVQSGSAGTTEDVGVNVRGSGGGPGHKGVLQGEEGDGGGTERSRTNKRKKRGVMQEVKTGQKMKRIERWRREEKRRGER